MPVYGRGRFIRSVLTRPGKTFFTNPLTNRPQAWYKSIMPTTQANQTRRIIRLTAYSRETNQFVEKLVTIRAALPKHVRPRLSRRLMAEARSLLANATEYGWEVVA